MPEEDLFYKDIIENLYDGVYFVDRDRRITYWNKGAERITGYSSPRVVGRSCRDNLLNHVNTHGIELCKDFCPLVASMTDGQPHEADVFLHHANGHRVPVLVRVAPMRDAQGNIIGAVETFSIDRGERTVRHELRELRQIVNKDTLTGISNRQYMEGRLRGVLAELSHHSSTAGLLFLDIDEFKHINDTYGHEAGDQVLRMVANTLQHNLRESDAVGRWGGEEFLAILPDVESLEKLIFVAEKLRTLIEFSRLDLETSSLSVTISVGATLFLPKDTPETAVSRADGLMYKSKQAGRNRVTAG